MILQLKTLHGSNLSKNNKKIYLNFQLMHKMCVCFLRRWHFFEEALIFFDKYKETLIECFLGKTILITIAPNFLFCSF